MEQEQDKDLAVMLSSGKFVNEAGEEFPLRPFPFGSVVEVAKCAAKLIDKVLGMPDTMLDDLKLMVANRDLDPTVIAFFLELLGDAIEDVFKLNSICANKPIQWVKDLDPVDGIILTYCAFETNKSFFTKSLPRLLKTLGMDKKLAKIQEKAKELQSIGVQ